MRCPKCTETLSLTTRHGVEIDFCPKCKGIWLDRGELDKVIDRVAEHFAGPKQGYATTAHQTQPKVNRFQVYPNPETNYQPFPFEDFFDFD